MQTSISAELRRRFAEAKRVLVLTGAGVSAESGVPTFRGGGNTATWKGMPFEVISSGRMLERNLPVVWEWFDYRRSVLASLEPNPAHHEIGRWQERFPDFTLVTQNVGGLRRSSDMKHQWAILLDEFGGKSKGTFWNHRWSNRVQLMCTDIAVDSDRRQQ